MQQKLNDQFIQELYNSNLYLAMSFYCYENNYPGFGQYFCNQSRDERLHAMKFADYMLQRKLDITITAIESTPTSWPDLSRVFQSALMAEKINTSNINNLYSQAEVSGDTATASFLKWFVDEQVKEVTEAQQAYDKIVAANGNTDALLELDNLFKEKNEVNND